MATYAQVTKQLGDVWVDALKRAEESVTTAGRTRQPVRRSASAARRTRVFGQELPTMHEVVEANFDLAERVLKAQKHYALKAVEAAFPETPKSAAAPAHKPAARKPRRRARTSRATPVAHA